MQGGENSVVSPSVGLSAYQLLEDKVVLLDGSLATSKRCTKPRLFRDIRKGGPAYGCGFLGNLEGLASPKSYQSFIYVGG